MTSSVRGEMRISSGEIMTGESPVRKDPRRLQRIVQLMCEKVRTIKSSGSGRAGGVSKRLAASSSIMDFSSGVKSGAARILRQQTGGLRCEQSWLPGEPRPISPPERRNAPGEGVSLPSCQCRMSI